MTGSPQIEYLRHSQIDKTKWDDCIHRSRNGLVYALSVYLDHMSPGWDALVMNDYEAVFPLPWRKKFGITYIYQPVLIAQLGLFGNELREEVLNNFLHAIPGKFRYIDLPLNYQNNTFSPFSFTRKNYILSLAKSYDDIYNGFAKNVKRNILKAERHDCITDKTISVTDVIHLAKTHIHEREQLHHFEKLYEAFANNKQAVCYGVRHAESIIAAAAFLFYRNRAYYILAGNHDESRSRGASHLLVNEFIKDYASSGLVLDFEGSDVPGIAQFYASYGAVEEDYPALRCNRLPLLLKWLKK